MTFEETPFDVVVNNGGCRMSGEIVGDCALAMSAKLHQLAAAKGPVGLDVDLRGVSFIDSVGLRELLRLRQTWPTIRVVAVSQRVHRRLVLTGTAELLLEADA